MHVSTSLPEWRQRRAKYSHKSIGLVPTMGALHAGHASLVERARRENEIVQVTLFVNPTQFNDPNDLRRYPRTVDEDLSLLQSLGADEVLMPPANALYPDGYLFRISAEPLTQIMEGRHRPGFFDGVMTVVMKLFQLAQANRAYFGEKDFQQLQIVTKMAADFFLSVEVVPCPTVRAASGLALSSRNNLLSEEGRAQAALIHQAITQSETAAQASETLTQAGFQVDYVEDHWRRRFAAAFLEGIRLIDNVPLEN